MLKFDYLKNDKGFQSKLETISLCFENALF